MQQEKTGHVAELALLNPSLHDRNGIEVKNEHQSGNNDVEAAKRILSEHAKYLSAIYEQMMGSEIIKSILDN